MSREILETALNHYEGTVLYVSHDRYFINKTASRILELSGQTLTNYLGNYDYYLDLGTYYRFQGKYSDAAAAWNKAVEIDPTYFQIAKKRIENTYEQEELEIEKTNKKNI